MILRLLWKLASYYRSSPRKKKKKKESLYTQEQLQISKNSQIPEAHKGFKIKIPALGENNE